MYLVQLTYEYLILTKDYPYLNKATVKSIRFFKLCLNIPYHQGLNLQRRNCLMKPFSSCIHFIYCRPFTEYTRVFGERMPFKPQQIKRTSPFTLPPISYFILQNFPTPPPSTYKNPCCSGRKIWTVSPKLAVSFEPLTQHQIVAARIYLFFNATFVDVDLNCLNLFHYIILMECSHSM